MDLRRALFCLAGARGACQRVGLGMDGGREGAWPRPGWTHQGQWVDAGVADFLQGPLGAAPAAPSRATTLRLASRFSFG